MAEFYDEPSSKRLTHIPRLALLGAASLAGVVGVGFLAHAMLTPSLPTMPSSPATAQMYVIPEYQPPSTEAGAIRPAEPLPAAEVSTKGAVVKPAPVAAIPPKPLTKPIEVSRRCEADECVSWEDTVTKALAAPAASGQARTVTPRASATQPVVMLDGPIQPMPLDGPVLMEREPTTVGGIAKSAASTVVTTSGKLVDDLMRWSDKTVSKLVPPRWASADEQTTQQ